ncbi:uncharacterized protein LOC125217986 isoform X3 [Salvia hispanica]|uniref:uncharacterized protein LOC125217986 isoform X3 n=1 Tax=Salvia hispanica TaxID=49212 RepID=UPI00200905BD|nr:uncharacterized protein LOC125217986 isoform X3 [Salvia hispanica]
MRFKAGDTVEVMQSKEVLASWRAAEILSCSRDTYTIQYVCYPGMENKPLVEVVSRKLLRPCPSSLQGAKCFITGDIVEVFHQYSWKIAVVLNVLGGKNENRNNKIHHKVSTCKKKYLVRLLGCSKELAIDRTKVRARQAAHDVKWLQLTKIAQAGSDVIVSKPSKSNCFPNMNFQVPVFNSKSKYQPGDDCGSFQDEAALRESAVISSRSLKRMSPYISSVVEANEGPVQKFRAAEKEDRKQRMVEKGVKLVLMPKLGAPANYFMSDVYEMPIIVLSDHGFSWRHVSFASNGIKMMPVCNLSLGIELWTIQSSTITDMPRLWPLPDGELQSIVLNQVFVVSLVYSHRDWFLGS